MTSLSIRSKLATLVFGLVLLGVGGSSLFLMNAYRRERWTGTIESERFTVERAADRLDDLMLLTEFMDPKVVAHSRRIVFMMDGVCPPISGGATYVSNAFKDRLKELQLEPSRWLEAVNLISECQKLKLDARPRLIQAGPSLDGPTVIVLSQFLDRSRLSLISLEGFSSRDGNTVFLMEPGGELVWAADGKTYLSQALADTSLSPGILKQIGEMSSKSGVAQVQQLTPLALVSFKGLDDGRVVVSLSHVPTVMRPIYVATVQTLILILGFLFLCIAIGNVMTTLFMKPIGELETQSNRLAGGDLDARLSIEGPRELRSVKVAFNALADRIRHLLAQTRDIAYLEKEILLAGELQSIFVPPSRVPLQDFTLLGTIETASHCGGDWWGYFEIERPGRRPLLLLFIGDVEGHGTASALVSAAAQGALAMLANALRAGEIRYEGTSQIVSYFNRAVCQATKCKLWMTFVVVAIDPDEKTMECCNAGHTLPYLLARQDDGGISITALQARNSSIGQAIDMRYDETCTAPWEPGSQLVLYSDGFVDADQDGVNLFARKTLVKTLKEIGSLQGEPLFQKLLERRKALIGGLKNQDDVTLLLCSSPTADRPAK